MANLTLSIDDDVLRLARIRALEQNTSVNALVRDYLEDLAEDPETLERERRAWAAFSEGARRSTASSGPEGRTWTREDLYDRFDDRR